MLRALFQVQRKRSLVELNLSDEEEPLFGYVTYVDEDTFDIYTIDNVYNPAVVMKEGNVLMTETEDDAKSIDFTIIKITRCTDSVYGIVHDVSHALEPERKMWLDSQRNFVYNQAQADLIEDFGPVKKKPKIKFVREISKKDDDKEELKVIDNGNQ